MPDTSDSTSPRIMISILGLAAVAAASGAEPTTSNPPSLLPLEVATGAHGSRPTSPRALMLIPREESEPLAAVEPRREGTDDPEEPWIERPRTLTSLEIIPIPIRTSLAVPTTTLTSLEIIPIPISPGTDPDNGGTTATTLPSLEPIPVPRPGWSATYISLPPGQSWCPCPTASVTATVTVFADDTAGAASGSGPTPDIFTIMGTGGDDQETGSAALESSDGERRFGLGWVSGLGWCIVAGGAAILADAGV